VTHDVAEQCFRAKLRTDVPDGVILMFLRCWVLLYGALAMEVFGHLDFALDDSAPMFELTLGELAAKVGLSLPRHTVRSP
jgi:hypothetical protein